MNARRALIMGGIPLLLMLACTAKQSTRRQPWDQASSQAPPAALPASQVESDTLTYDFLAEAAPLEEGSGLAEADLPELVTEDQVSAPRAGSEAPPPARSSAPRPAVDESPLFWVQIFASGSRQSAEEFAVEADARLSERVRILYLEPYYKVLVGGLPTREDAVSLRQALVELGYEGAWIFEK